MNKYADKNVAQLHEIRDALLEAKKANAKIWQEAESSGGKLRLERLTNELTVARGVYGKIPVDGREAADVVRQLAVSQATEKMLVREVKLYTDASAEADRLDEEIKLVDQTITAKEARKSR